MAPLTSAMLLQVLVLLPLLLWHPSPASAKWQTLSGQAPVVIANGGNSGLYPDQTLPAYYDALLYGLSGIVISCDLQVAPTFDSALAVTGQGICRTGLNLQNSTTIAINGPQFNTTRIVNGQSITGFFAIDIPYENLTQLALATQSNVARSPAYDGANVIIDPTQLPILINQSEAANSKWWLNSEYMRFIEENSPLNVSLYFLSVISALSPGYVSVPEIGQLKQIQAAGPFPQTKVIYKFLDTQTQDASTNQTYVSLLKNLTFIKTLASGILVPKSLIWPIDQNTLYLQTPTTLVQDAHKVGLEVYAYDFANDQYPNSYNYTLDPITEILYFTETYNFSVDGFFADFPLTASEAISCYASNSRTGSPQNKQASAQKLKVISHNGNSGKFPGATSPAYYSAITAGVDYIDCIVQISKDSIPFCRPTVNLIDSTDVSAHSDLIQEYLTSYPGFYSGNKGVFAFDLTWDQIETLRAIMYSPEAGISRDTNYDGQFGVITLADFLSIAKNNSIGVLITIENAVYIRDVHNLAVVDAVVGALSAAGYKSTDKVILQSEDSAALARLRDLNVTYPLMYEVLDDENTASLNANDFVEIKQYASSVNFNARQVEPFDSNFFLSYPPTDVIALAHQQNLTTYFEVQKNEFTAFAFDLMADPTLELYSLMNDGIDGVITDFPTTVENFLGNQCLGNGLASSLANYSVRLIVRGDLGNQTYVPPAPAPAPAPLLVVPEPPLLGLSLAPGPAPAAMPASASHISTHFLLAAVSVILYVLVVV
ncbi:unnamed protein product [Calypogeia fissa]